MFAVCAMPCTDEEVENWYTLLKGLQADWIIFVTDCPISAKMRNDGVEVYPTLASAIAAHSELDGYDRVLADMSDLSTDLTTFTHPYDGLYVFGPSHQPVDMTGCDWEWDHTVYIPCAIDTGYYSVSAGAIMLWDRLRQTGV